MSRVSASHLASEQADDALLEVRRLNLDFRTPRGRVHALRDVTVTVPRGGIVGVVGESGCGKSTLAFAIIRLLAENALITGGEIRFGDQDLLTLSPRRMRAIRGRRMSMVFQDPMTALNRVLSIGQHLVDIQYRDSVPKAEKRHRAVKALARVGIPDAENRLRDYPHQFSGGMRQRICIAMALLVKPALLLADEPTTALDATMEVQIIELLKHLQTQLGCSILFVSHHLGTVAELCDNVVVMYAGEVVEHGSVRDIFNRPGHPYTQALLECDPGRIRQKTRHLPTIPGNLPNLLAAPEGCIFKGRCPQVFERCYREKPSHHEVTEGHTASCHLRDKSRRERS